MLFNALVQLLCAAAWMGIIAGSVIFMRRGYSGAATSTLIGATIMLLMRLFHATMMTLIMTRVIDGYPGRYSPFIVQVPPLLGMLLFVVGFLQLARAMRRT